MALLKAASLLVTAAAEAASLVWMELAMFGAAAVLYVLFMGVLPRIRGTGKSISMHRKVGSGKEQLPRGSCTSSEGQQLRDPAAKGDHHASMMQLWQRAKALEDPPRLDLVAVVDAMRKAGSSVSEVVAELRTAMDSNPKLLEKVTALPAALLRDDQVELLDATLAVLEERGQPADVAAYAGLMAAQFRRRDHVGVAATAARLPGAPTTRMRALLAASAAHRGRLDEALGQLRQIPEAAPAAKSVLSPAGAAQILALAAKEHRVPEAAQELQRVQASLEAKHFESILAGREGRLGPGLCRELLAAGVSLGLPLGPGAYQALANSVAVAPDAAGLQELLGELQGEAERGPEGVAVSEPLVLALLEACKAVREAAMALQAFELHRAACAGAPGGKVVSAVCSALLTCAGGKAACDFYEKEMLPKGIWPDANLTGVLLKAAATLGRTAMAQRLSDHADAMRAAAPHAPTAGGSELQRHATMIKAYARERDLNAASKVFNRLRSSGSALSPLIYNSFLDACVQCGEVERAMKHFEEMKQLNYIDVVGYNTMIKAHLARGHTEEARALVKEMASRGLQANKVTYNELLHAKVLAKDRRGMWSIIDEMQVAGVQPNPVTCSILLKSLTLQSSPSDVKQVVALIGSMEEPIDEVLLSSVIEACIRIRQLDLLSDFMHRYRSKGGFVNLTAPTYGSMIKAYGQAGDVGRVRELWLEMEDQRVKPTSITLGCMTEALVANGHAEEALELIHKQLENEERRDCINTVIYSTVLKGFAVTRRIDKVFVVYKEMRAKGIPCNTITYNTMLDACAKSCAMSRASQLLEDMQESRIEPDIITYSTIVKGYCVEGDVDRAFHVLEEMKRDNKFAPDEIMYNSILDGCAKQHRMEDALRILEEMKSSGVSPSNYTLSILVKLLGHARSLNQAFRMVEELSTQNGFSPNVQVYTCLVQACILNRRLERALSLHDKMVADAGCATDDKFYAVLARGCLQLHQPMKAVEVVRAAYQLPGHTLAAPARDGSPVGVEPRTLEDIVARLQGGGKEEQEAAVQLIADLLELRNLRVGDRRAGAGDQDSRRRRGGAMASRGGGR